VNLEEEGFRNLVLNVLEEVTPEEQQRAAATNNRHYLHRTIGDIIEKLKKEK
jgi:CO/xanthine dehydrogenase FAD-binding subunit